MNFDAYQSPEIPYDGKGTDSSPGAEIPKAFRVFCFIAIAFGCLGLFNGFCGVVSTLGVPIFLEQVKSAIPEDDPDREQFELMMQQFEQMKWIGVALGLLGTILGILQVTSGWTGLKRAKISSTIFLAMAGFAIFLMIVTCIAGIVNLDASLAMQKQQMGPNGPPPIDPSVEFMIKGMSITFNVVWTLVWVILYGMLAAYIVRSKQLKQYLSYESA